MRGKGRSFKSFSSFRPGQAAITCVGLALWLSVPSYAGILLAAPARPVSSEFKEELPDSRFGSLPIRSDMSGSDDHEYYSKVDNNQGSRRPAGFEFTDQTGQVKSTPIITEVGTPSSMANQNPKPSSPSRMGVQEIALIAGDLGFFPKTLFVTKDIPVRLFVTGSSKKSLCVMMDFFQIRRQVRSQKIEEISFTPSAVGQFRFYCPINGMEGTLLVKQMNAISSPSRRNASESTPLGIAEKEPGD